MFTKNRIDGVAVSTHPPAARGYMRCLVDPCAAIGLLLLLTALQAHASPLVGTKELIWNANAPVEGMLGDYTLKSEATASCGCHTAKMCPDPLTGNWPLTTGLSPAVSLPSGVASVAHAECFIETSFRADAPVPHPSDPALVRYTTYHGYKVAVRDGLTPCPSGVSKNETLGEVHARIEGATVVGRDLVNTDFEAVVRTKLPLVGDVVSPYRHERHVFRDPISVELFEAETGVTHVERLFELAITLDSDGATGEILAEWDWEFGLKLGSDTGGTGGSMTVQGRADSSWLSSPIGVFGATLQDGIFEATGAWEFLPWDLTYDGELVTSAFLDASYLLTDLSYAVPESLIDPDYSYKLSLVSESGLESFALIPEPTTLALLVLGGLVMELRRR